YKENGEALRIDGRWDVQFVEGGSVLPALMQIDTLTSWTNFGMDYEVFSGSATYRTEFRKPSGTATAWRLDLGTVKESARVVLNGKELATLIGPTFEVIVPSEELRDENTLEVTVSNLMANRIADLDKRKVFWKKFYNVNFPARKPENRKNGLFDASEWTPRESGLIGPVTLKGLSRVEQ
ncbi:MAG: glycosylhydrolase-like jelly roll fold domain-containing protein, partial [Bacteroidota bacterium]